MVPTRRLAALAAILGVALWFYPGDLVGGLWGTLGILNGLLVALGALDAAVAPAASNIEISRSFPPVVVMGTEAEWRWRLVNRGARRMKVRIADELAPSLHARRRRFQMTLEPRARAEVSTVIHPSRRGRFVVSELVVRVEGPLGLCMRQRRRQMPSVLRVYPPFRSRDEAELRIRKARILEVGLRSAKGVGGGTEFEQLREYTPDDELRRVDWAASARTGRMIVRTYRPERNQTVILLLDNGRLMAAQVGGVPRIEHAMDAAIMVGHVATHLGDKAGMITFDAAVRSIVPPARRHDQTSQLTEAMYALEPVLLESDYQGAFTAMMARFRRRSLIVILSDLAEQSVGDTLLPALPLILRHHVVVIGAVRDPEVVAWASSVPADAEEAYRKAAAVSALVERDRTVARLRGVGATVIDAPPGRLAPQLADAYLAIKSTGRL
ncbi:MAG: DUF58 domain-containing protein [Microthrixaceae bacterium]|nr:DUF58 domain-containing protein [Microthrixaceae bacterium]